jgi:hypothetical protein
LCTPKRLAASAPTPGGKDFPASAAIIAAEPDDCSGGMMRAIDWYCFGMQNAIMVLTRKTITPVRSTMRLRCHKKASLGVQPGSQSEREVASRYLCCATIRLSTVAINALSTQA